jgi:hypothetical protein
MPQSPNILTEILPQFYSFSPGSSSVIPFGIGHILLLPDPPFTIVLPF